MAHHQYSLREKVFLGFAGALFILAAIAYVSYVSTQDFLRVGDRVTQSREVLETQESLLRHLVEVESGVRGFRLTGNEIFLQQHEASRRSVGEDLVLLRKLVTDNPRQQAHLEPLDAAIARRLSIAERNVERARANPPKLPPDRTDQESHELMSVIREALSAVEADESELLQQRADLTESLGRTTRMVIALGTVIAAGIAGFAAMVILRETEVRRRAAEDVAEERNLLRSVIDAIPEIINVKDTRGCYVIDNLAHREYHGKSRPEEIEGRTVFDFFPPDLANRYNADDQLVFSSGVPVVNREEPGLDQNGKLTWLSTNKVPLQDREKRTVGVVCVSANITERKRVEEQLRVFSAQLERSNVELQNFASIASHDLQEPLRKIQAFADRLRKKCEPGLGETGLDYLSRIDGATRRMAILIQDLLTLSRITSRAQPYEPVDLGAIAHEVVNDLEVPIEQTGAHVEVGNLGTIDADPLQMRQLFQNLLSNALKFQAPGTVPVVSISAKELAVHEKLVVGVEPGESVCQIQVTDNGIGFESKYGEQIFTLFQRLHGRHEYEGTGIGLAICRKIAERHGGDIFAKSSLGTGTTFIVTLPSKQKEYIPS